MIEIKDKTMCCGCEACANICPQKCITMKEDIEGFRYPSIDKEKCTNCELCNKVCQYKNSKLPLNTDKEAKVYSCVLKNEKDLENSSTAAVFYNLGKYIIKMGGIVYGAKYDEDMEVVHTRINSLKELEKLRGSKYIQSKIGKSYNLVKKDLLNNKVVLFSGTPCQVGGLYKFLGKDYENLITIDIVCYGVPSPKIFRDYIRKKEKKYGSKVVYVNFRDRKNGWMNKSTRIIFENKNIDYCIPTEQDEWYNIFISHISTRESCNNCLYTSIYRKSDITLGDFWGIEDIDKDIDIFYGVEKVILNTKKGKEIFKNIENKYNIKVRKIEDAIRPNFKHPPEKSKYRDKFFEIYDNKGYKKAAKMAFTIRRNDQFIDRAKRKIKRIVKKLLIKGKKK